MPTWVTPVMTVASEDLFSWGREDDYATIVLFSTFTLPCQGVYSEDPEYITATCGVGMKHQITQ